MKAIFLSNGKQNIINVYNQSIINKISAECDLDKNIYNKKEILEKANNFNEVEVIFSTWGMPGFSKEEILTIFPKLKSVFYAAGSVQEFAQPFLDLGIKVYSAAAANAIPVAEFTFSEIVLAAKGYFKSARLCKTFRSFALKHTNSSAGNYQLKVGIIGVGAIGKLVCQKLKNIDCQIFAYDPFLSKDYAIKNNITLTSLEDIFKNCDVVTNHLANKKELEHIFNYKLFSLMKPYSTFINTGRGKQVDEKGLSKVLFKNKTLTALLDVTYPEVPSIFSPLRYLKNAVLTPHIAGSLSNELWRMSEYMFTALQDFKKGIASTLEVTLEMLKTLA